MGLRCAGATDVGHLVIFLKPVACGLFSTRFGSGPTGCQSLLSSQNSLSRHVYGDFADLLVLQGFDSDPAGRLALQQLDGYGLLHGLRLLRALPLRGFPEIAMELLLQQIQQRPFAVRKVALFGCYHLFEVLCMVGYHGTFQVMVYHPRADI